MPAIARQSVDVRLKAATTPQMPNNLARGLPCAPRTSRPGRAPVALTAALRHHAGDDGGIIAIDLLQQAAAADGRS